MPNIGYTLDDHEKGPIEISTSPTNMPNIGYTLDGYDLMKGNPLTTGANVDPGYRQAIFDASYTGKAVRGGSSLFFPARAEPSQNIFKPSEPRAFNFLLQAFASQNFLYSSLLRA